MNKPEAGRGIFISLEGGEGAGKTTQINLLRDSLTGQQGYEVVTTREPGGTPEGEKIRDLLVQRDGGAWTPMAEILLFLSARVMHVEKLIKPALAAGKIVISDRFSDSTLAYQGYGHGFDLEKIQSLSALALNNFVPDLTFILDIDPKVGLGRSNRRLGAEEGAKNKEDRFERMDFSFHEKLRQGFLSIAKVEPARCKVISAALSIDDIAAFLLEETLKKLRNQAV